MSLEHDVQLADETEQAAVLDLLGQLVFDHIAARVRIVQVGVEAVTDVLDGVADVLHAACCWIHAGRHEIRYDRAQVNRVSAIYDLDRGVDVLLLDGDERVARQGEHQTSELNQVLLLRKKIIIRNLFFATQLVWYNFLIIFMKQPKKE